MSHQDWEPIVIGKPKNPRTPTQKVHHVRPKVNDEDIPIIKKHLSVESRQLLTQERVKKGLSQVQLNTLCAFPLNTIRDIESGKVVPNGTQLNILRRELGIQLKLSETISKHGGSSYGTSYGSSYGSS